MTDGEFLLLLDAEFYREKTYEYRDMCAELKRLVRTLRHTATCYMEGTLADSPRAVAANCADAIEAVLYSTADEGATW